MEVEILKNNDFDLGEIPTLDKNFRSAFICLYVLE